MKRLSFLVIIFTILSLSSFSQNNSVIESVSVNYRAPSMIADTSDAGSIKVLPEATIKLLTTDSISKIYLKIISTDNQTVLYDVNYTINAGDVIDGNGKVLFSKSGTTLYINGSTILSLAPYSYELRTEDNASNLSAIFSEIH